MVNHFEPFAQTKTLFCCFIKKICQELLNFSLFPSTEQTLWPKARAGERESALLIAELDRNSGALERRLQNWRDTAHDARELVHAIRRRRNDDTDAADIAALGGAVHADPGLMLTLA